VPHHPIEVFEAWPAVEGFLLCSKCCLMCTVLGVPATQIITLKLLGSFCHTPTRGVIYSTVMTDSVLEAEAWHDTHWGKCMLMVISWRDGGHWVLHAVRGISVTISLRHVGS
jgi:hypothetical protein